MGLSQRSNIHVTGVPEREEKEGRSESTWRNSDWKLSELIEDINLDFQEVEWIPTGRTGRNPHQGTSQNSEISWQRNNLESNQGDDALPTGRKQSNKVKFIYF